MAYLMTVYTPEGLTREIGFAKSPPGDAIRGELGGWMQEIATQWCTGMGRCRIYANEDGMSLGLLPNLHGTRTIGFKGDYPILGPIVVIRKV